MAYYPNNPSGPAGKASSTPVTIASDQPPLADIAATGNLTALNSAVSIATNSAGTVVFEIGGTFVGTFTFEASNNAFVTSQAVAAVYLGGLAGQSASFSAPGFYSVLTAGFTQLRVRMSAYTSGTATVVANSTTGNRISVALQGNPANLQVTATQGPASATPWPVSQPDLLITGAAAQTTLGNNALLAAAGTANTDASGYRSGSVQVVSTGTGGTYIFEHSNDGTNFQTMTVYNSAILTGTPITAAITATASQLIYTFPIRARYIRLRIVTAITGGSIQPFTRISQESWSPAIVQVANATAANLATSATIASGTVTTVSSVTALAAINSVATTNGLSIGTVITPTTPATNSIKASAGRLHFMHVGNPNTSAVYLKIFNLAAPVLGTTSANMNFYIPASSSISIPISDQGLFFSTAIVTAVTAAAALNDNTVITTGCVMNYSWI